MLDVDKFISGIHDYLERAFAPVNDRLKALEQRTIPEAVNGKDGRDGQDGINGQDGAPGKDGKDGVNGTDGKSVTTDDILPTVKAWFDALPIPASGKDGADGKSITVDDIAEFMESSIAKWALDFERRAQDLLQRAIERIPAPKDGADGVNGKDGRDALDIENFDAVLEEDGRTVTLSLSRGDTRIERKLSLPHVIYRGIYRPEETYQRGDSVTFGGSTWIKCTDAPGKPGEDSAGWKLAVKTGRNGKSAYDLARGNGFIGSEREWLESLKAKKDNPSSVVKR